MDVNHLLLLLGEKIGLRDLKLNDSGVCAIIFDEKTTLAVEPNEQQIFLYTVLKDSINLLNREDLEFFLAANLFGQNTGGCTLAIDNLLGQLILFKVLKISDELDAGIFLQAFEQLYDQTKKWQETLKTSNQAISSINNIFLSA
ncbi:MAG: hypothetical protein A2Y14_05850 [Verrucomicrobia bacterium GWF2_51_19]|nr:MAG: hypothetical protein A2Y14_05850 [Verrucomicrobia bacterium GWF2_51_19]HCJ12174.1 hypothetical protein [Opitutae bacterium]